MEPTSVTKVCTDIVNALPKVIHRPFVYTSPRELGNQLTKDILYR